LHPGGQILFITEGRGYYQAKGQPARLLHKGDYVDSLNSDEGGAVRLGPVTDEEYGEMNLY
jgi:hypothetical protein